MIPQIIFLQNPFERSYAVTGCFQAILRLLPETVDVCLITGIGETVNVLTTEDTFVRRESVCPKILTSRE